MAERTGAVQVELAMKIGRIALIASAAAALSACAVLQRHPVGNRAVPMPAKQVDLQRYLGTWYEIARYEQAFQRGCEGVTATYGLLADGKISVLNRCRKPDGRITQAAGKAKVVDLATGARLKVSFFGPFYIGDYWVLDHAEDYSWAIVGDPSGRYLWLLHRSAAPSAAEVRRLIDRAASLGSDVTMLRRTKQP
jgi:apolipoprotein D and lipocalin family protein